MTKIIVQRQSLAFVRTFVALLILFTTIWFAFAEPSPVSADTKLFEQAGWIVSGAQDSAPNARKIRVLVAGQFVGNYSELKIARKQSNTNYPQVFSVKGSGALRAVLPGGDFGGTFYATGYWDCTYGFVQNLPITKLNIRLNTDKTLQLKGKAINASFRAPNFTLRVLKPKNQTVSLNVSYRLVARRDLCVDSDRQDSHEGFRLARIASMFLSKTKHDSNRALYINSSNTPVCANLKNQNRFILANPTTLGLPALLSLVHTTSQPRKTPTLSIEFVSPPGQEITPQGWVSKSSIANADNVDFWGNWDSASAQYAAGQVIGNFEYTLKATAPGTPACS